MKRLNKEDKDRLMNIILSLKLKGLNDCAIRRYLKDHEARYWEHKSIAYYESLAYAPENKVKQEQYNALMQKWNAGTNKTLTPEEQLAEDLGAIMMKPKEVVLNEVEYEDLR